MTGGVGCVILDGRFRLVDFLPTYFHLATKSLPLLALVRPSLHYNCVDSSRKLGRKGGAGEAERGGGIFIFFQTKHFLKSITVLKRSLKLSMNPVSYFKVEKKSVGCY